MVTYLDANGRKITVSAANPLPTSGGGAGGAQVTPVLTAGTDRGGTSVAGATTVAPENLNRKAMTFQNTSDTAMRLTENGVAATATTGYLVAAGQAVNVSTNRSISAYCQVAGKTFASTEL